MNLLIVFTLIGVWEQRKLIDLVVRLNKSTNSSRLPKLEFEDIVAGEGRLNKDVSQKFDNRKGIEFLPNDILYGKLRPYLKNWLKATFTGVALGDFWVFRVKNSDSDFIYSLIQADRYQKAANDTSGTKMPRSDWKKVSGTVFYVPNDLKEQQKIGTLFKQIDDAITLHQRKSDQLKELKKAYLQLMFPKKDETVPRVRFADFEGEWEQCKLKNLFLKGGSGGTPTSSNSDYYNGDIPFLSISDITKSNGYVYTTEKCISLEGLKNSSAWIVPKESISLAMYASVGKVAILKLDIATSQAFYNMIFEDINTRNYIYHYLIKKEVFNEWITLISTGTQANLNADKVKNTFVLIPSNNEQKKIAELLSCIEVSIDIQQKKIHILKSLKKSYLQNMFI